MGHTLTSTLRTFAGLFARFARPRMVTNPAFMRGFARFAGFAQRIPEIENFPLGAY